MENCTHDEMMIAWKFDAPVMSFCPDCGKFILENGECLPEDDIAKMRSDAWHQYNNEGGVRD